jgi:hypothetical protein
MWYTVELVRDLCARQEVLSSHLTHHKGGLSGFILRLARRLPVLMPDVGDVDRSYGYIYGGAPRTNQGFEDQTTLHVE